MCGAPRSSGEDTPTGLFWPEPPPNPAAPDGNTPRHEFFIHRRRGAAPTPKKPSPSRLSGRGGGREAGHEGMGLETFRACVPLQCAPAIVAALRVRDKEVGPTRQDRDARAARRSVAPVAPRAREIASAARGHEEGMGV